MRRIVPVALVVMTAGAGLTSLSLASGAAPPRAITAAAPVTGLAADGQLVGFAVGRRGRDCFRVELWNRTTGSVKRLGKPRPCGPETSTGQGLVGPVIAANRALWLTYTGGNIREWMLWTATTTRRTPRRLAFVARDVDSPPPIVLGAGDSEILPYAVDRRVVALRAGGARRFTWTAPARVVALAANAGELAAAVETGDVYLLDRNGVVLYRASLLPRVDAVALGGTRLVIQGGRRLVLRRNADQYSSWTLPSGARLVDADGETALYVAGSAVHAFRLDTGADSVARRTAGQALAQLEGRTLVVASGRRIAASRL
jgi:hypothetical protein